MAFLALAYPILVGLNLLFALVWLWWKNKRFLLPMVAIALGYAYLPGLFAVGESSEPNANEGDVQVMSYNVRLFDLYNWFPGHTKRADMLKMLHENDPDILCMQEYFYYDWRNPEFSFETRDTLMTMLSATNVHEEFLFNVPDKFRNENTHRIGMATYTRYPIINKGKISFSGHTNNLCMYTDVLIDADTVRIYNVHLASVQLAKDEKDLTASQDEGSTRRIIGKLKRAFERRVEQARAVREHVAQSPYPPLFRAILTMCLPPTPTKCWRKACWIRTARRA